MEVDALNGFVDDAMAYCQHRLARIGHLEPRQEVLRTAFHVFQRLYVVRPFGMFKIRNKLSRKATPVALSQKRCRDDMLLVHSMRRSNDGARLYGTMQITGHKHVNGAILHLFSHLTGLMLASVIEFTTLVALQNLCFVGHGLTMAHKI